MDSSRITWRKSSLSGNGGADCVEVATVSSASVLLSGHRFAVRDSKNPNGPELLFTPGQWTAFVGGIKHGEFDTLS
ncbi:protein of unknown function [Streptosporangium subroseum]|uniref:DUF397 domain-containing protein n=1 Tax=Streptosporangium subroseum TaxID=106412 RepID=A0A239P6H4_9ACTN|nr:DUF397 domain-containing protein [Streptosporangium subroseum]SNT62552.1 protein of unknown function [Streptosporangium subroseum]